MTGIRTYLAVGAGTALGSLCRYAVSVGVLATAGGAFPWATLLVNAFGSGLIGWLATRATRDPQSHWVRHQSFWVTGFCAGFTTFSLFSLETLHLMERHTVMAAAYIVASLVLWLLGVRLGQGLARSR
ncbi:fluoride efflux transporter FluC [Vreelandella malpeensis]|uniref:Fluoride-specific ion channel FluC n=1 Tax=Vreelandella malpeensis TaxID=1172368 RepID=A0ABS8DRH8_9GAMM|nr:CrcB family protein [Halomonas malpeensis]